MNVKQIVVDELPESCWECKAIKGVPPKYLYCFDRHIDIDVYATRPSWCPLVVEEVCEWGTHSYDELCEDWNYCPSCGKRIKYVESEE